jgi:hypothetical protein
MSLRNRLVVSVSICSLVVLAACGNNGFNTATPPPTGSFSNSDLNGTYVFSVTGSDVNFAFLTMVGTLTANGSGGITGGTVDINDPLFSAPVTALPITGGTYRITPDGRGQATLSAATPFGSSITVVFVLASSAHGLIIEFDGNGTGSGTLDMQSTVTQGQIAGSYAFNFTGISSFNTSTGAEPVLATAGAFTLDGNGNVTTGIQDFNNNGDSVGETALGLAGTVNLSTVPGTATLTAASGAFCVAGCHFDVYPVDATHLKFIGTDAFPILTGDVFTQTSSIPATNVFTMAGLDFASQGAPFTAAGLIVTNSGGLVTSGAEDINDAGTALQLTTLSGSYTTVSGGRSVLTLNQFLNGNAGLAGNYSFAAYPSSGGMQLLEIDNAGVTSGVAYPQTSTTLASTQGYGLNLTGINGGNGVSGSFEEDDIAEFTNTNGALSGLLDTNDQGTLTPNQKFGATYAADTTIVSRGTVTPTTNGFTLVTYVVDSSTTVFVEVDPSQLGLGSFALQTPTAKSNIAQMHLAALHLRPGAKNAWRPRQQK